MITKDKNIRRLKRVRSKLGLNLGIPRLSVYRSNQHLWVQIIDDKHGKTLASYTTKLLKGTKGTKTEKAFKVGEEIGKLALKLKIKNIRFDRGLYLYHGRVKAVADGARQAGLKF